MHERPEGMDEGTLIMSGLNKVNVLQSIKIVTDLQKRGIIMQQVKDYKSEKPSVKILKVIQSYIEYVNKNVWKK